MKRTRATKRKPQKFDTKAELLAHLIPACEKEYEATFDHPWNKNPLGPYNDDLRRSRIESEAWRVLHNLQKATAPARDFFTSRGLDPGRGDHGLHYAHKLHGLLKKYRRLFESLEQVADQYPRPLDKRHRLVTIINVRPPNAFAKLPYGKKLTPRKLAVIAILLFGGDDVGFKPGTTIAGAIDEERRRMALADQRAQARRKK